MCSYLHFIRQTSVLILETWACTESCIQKYWYVLKCWRKKEISAKYKLLVSLLVFCLLARCSLAVGDQKRNTSKNRNAAAFRCQKVSPWSEEFCLLCACRLMKAAKLSGASVTKNVPNERQQNQRQDRFWWHPWKYLIGAACHDSSRSIQVHWLNDSLTDVHDHLWPRL